MVERGLKRELLIFLIGGLVGSLVLGLILWRIKFSINVDEIATPYLWAVVSVALIVSSIMVYLAQACPSVFRKRGATPFLCPLILLLLAAFCSIGAVVVPEVWWWSVSYLVLGGGFFIYGLIIVIKEETYGDTLWEKLTKQKRILKEDFLDDPSDTISANVFGGHIQVNKGDAILTICNSMREARRLAKKFMDSGKHSVYITIDRPWTAIKKEFGRYQGNMYCIDLFTNFYGFDEFKKAEEFPGESFYPSAPKPVTIKRLHLELRQVRKRMVSRQKHHGRDWSELNSDQRRLVDDELASAKSTVEREMNVRIVYDSISSLASIVDVQDLLSFLIHDTNVDKTIGRNTLLLLKQGVLEDSIVKRIESFCDISLNLQPQNGQVVVHINKLRDQLPPADFPL